MCGQTPRIVQPAEYSELNSTSLKIMEESGKRNGKKSGFYWQEIVFNHIQEFCQERYIIFSFILSSVN